MILSQKSEFMIKIQSNIINYNLTTSDSNLRLFERVEYRTRVLQQGHLKNFSLK